MSRSAARWVVAALLLLPASSAQTQTRRVEGIAAVVGAESPGPAARVILRSDVDLRARIRLAGRSGRVPSGEIPEPLMAAVLEELIGEALLATEADRLRAARPGPDEVEAERQRLAREAGSAERLAEVLRSVGGDPQELEAVARRRAYVAAFLRANVEGASTVSDAQVQRAYDSGQHPFFGQPYEEVREVLRVWLGRQLLEAEVARWIDVLARRTPVRRVAGWTRS